MSHGSHQMRATSLDAYTWLRPSLKTRQGEVYEFMLSWHRAGGFPLIDLEMTRKMGFLDPNRVRPRRYELVEAGYVVEAGKRRCTISGRTVFTWQLAGSLNLPLSEDAL